MTSRVLVPGSLDAPAVETAAEAVLTSLMSRRRGTAPRGTGRIEVLCRGLGSPHLCVPALHVVGTDGKTSVVRIVAALLEALGIATGDTTSPHLQDVRERIRVAGQPVSPAALARACSRLPEALTEVARETGQPASFFEAVTAVALRVFVDADVDVAVVEAGIGGVGDATNVVQSRVAVLTPVGLDHPELGSSVAEVAREKAGVTEPGGILVSAAQSQEVASVVTRVAAARGATLLRAGPDFGVMTRRRVAAGQLVGLRGLGGTDVRTLLPLRGAHQAGNAATALAAVQALLGTDLDPVRLRAGFGAAHVPGRVELVQRTAGPPVMLDGAHDVPAVRALVAAVHEMCRPTATVVVLGMGAGRDPGPLVAELRRLTSTFVMTRCAAPTAAPAELLAAQVRATGLVPVVADDVATALTTAGRLAGPGGLVVVTGSLHLVGDARATLGGTPW